MTIYYNKYLKYKQKYLNLSNSIQLGGGGDEASLVETQTTKSSRIIDMKKKKLLYFIPTGAEDLQEALLEALAVITTDDNFEMSQNGSREIFSEYVVPYIQDTFGRPIYELILTESNAGFGGFTYLFISLFKLVNIVELDKSRLDIIESNIQIYRDILKFNFQTTFYEKNYCELTSKLIQDIVFADFPWGGPDYKLQRKLRLSIKNSKDIEVFLDEIIVELFKANKCKMFIFLKPFNFDIDELLKTLDNAGLVYTWRDFRDRKPYRDRKPSIFVITQIR
jgi:hypothetical protein